jgi:hypothetical protein
MVKNPKNGHFSYSVHIGGYMETAQFEVFLGYVIYDPHTPKMVKNPKNGPFWGFFGGFLGVFLGVFGSLAYAKAALSIMRSL